MKHNIALEEMGNKIKAARNKRGLTLVKLRELTDLHLSALSRIESGKHNSHILTLIRIADALKVDVKDFL